MTTSHGEMVPVGIAVVRHDGCYLVGIRGPSSALAGFHEFPGGKCRVGETGEQCAARECLEETGLAVKPVRLLETREIEYPHARVRLEFWLCEPAETADVAEDHLGFHWIPRPRLAELRFPEANASVISHLPVE